MVAYYIMIKTYILHETVNFNYKNPHFWYLPEAGVITQGNT